MKSQDKLQLTDFVSGKIYCPSSFYEELMRFHEKNFDQTFQELNDKLFNNLRNYFSKTFLKTT